MNNFLQTIISNAVLNEFIVIAIVICGVIFVFSKVRQQDLQVLRDSNADLRNSIDDKSKQINTLNTNISILQAQMVGLQGKVNALEKKNGDLENLVKEALVIYFDKNPNVASGFIAKI